MRSLRGLALNDDDGESARAFETARRDLGDRSQRMYCTEQSNSTVTAVRPGSEVLGYCTYLFFFTPPQPWTRIVTRDAGATVWVQRLQPGRWIIAEGARIAAWDASVSTVFAWDRRDRARRRGMRSTIGSAGLLKIRNNGPPFTTFALTLNSGTFISLSGNNKDVRSPLSPTAQLQQEKSPSATCLAGTGWLVPRSVRRGSWGSVR